ncbi:hypothetical protein ACQEU6_08455 [Spirillospora sp. CA-108201]
MEDNHAEHKRWDELTDELIAIYGVIRAVLVRLPLPIGLVHLDLGGGPEAVFRALQALNRARLALISDQPLEERHKDLLQQAILDWLLGWDMGSLTGIAKDPVGWRLDGLERLIRQSEYAAGQVALDLDLGED